MSPQHGDAAGGTQTSDLAARLRGFGPMGILAILVILAGNFILRSSAPFSSCYGPAVSHTRGARSVSKAQSWLATWPSASLSARFQISDEGDRDAASRRRSHQSGVPLPGQNTRPHSRERFCGSLLSPALEKRHYFEVTCSNAWVNFSDAAKVRPY